MEKERDDRRAGADASTFFFSPTSINSQTPKRREERSLKSTQQGRTDASQSILVSTLGQLTVSTYEERAARTKHNTI